MGLLRCYISRVENGHTVPAVETLEKLARAFEVPLYQLFYEGEEPPVLPNLLKRKSSDENAWGSTGKDARFLGSSAERWAKPTNKTASSLCSWPKKQPVAIARRRDASLRPAPEYPLSGIQKDSQVV